VKNDLVDMIS